MGSGGSNLALLARRKLGEITVVVALPACSSATVRAVFRAVDGIHLVVENLGLSRLSLGDQRLVQDVKNILADTLELSLDLLTIIADGANVLVRALGFFFLLD
jgi:limonene-1,2-epoxide hydrolase